MDAFPSTSNTEFPSAKLAVMVSLPSAAPVVVKFTLRLLSPPTKSEVPFNCFRLVITGLVAEPPLIESCISDGSKAPLAPLVL